MMTAGGNRLFTRVLDEPTRELTLERTQIVAASAEIAREPVIQGQLQRAIGDARVGHGALGFEAGARWRLTGEHEK